MASFLGSFARYYLQTQVRDLLHECGFDINKYRQIFATKTGAFRRLPADVKLEKADIAGITCEWLIPANVRDQDKFVLFYHGGGFVLDIQKGHYEFCADMAEQLGVKFLIAKYRLAPENPFPAAPEDCFAIYKALLQQGIRADQMVLAGDSAGGSLALSTLAMAQAAGLPLPTCAVVLSPVTGFGFFNWKKGRGPDTDQMFSRETFDFFIEQYLGKVRPPADIRVAPLMTGFKGFPPLLFTASENELLFEESVEGVKAAQQNGVVVEFHTVPDLFHVYPLMGILPEAKEAREHMLKFIRTHAGIA